jgi:chromosome partitioning protein
MCSGLLKASDSSKKFYFIDILLSRVDKADIVSNAVRQWIMTAYPGLVIPVEIPKTSIAATASADFGTAYDMDPSTTNAKTLKRARDAYDELVNYVEVQVKGIWSNDALSLQPGVKS